MFSASYCGACQMTKAYLSSKGVSFEEIDVSADETAAQYISELTGRNAIPVTLFEVSGKFVVGFDRNLIDQYLREIKTQD